MCTMYRELQSCLKLLLNQPKSPIILILGMRQSGKTTLAKNLVENRKHIIFNFDLSSDRLEFVNQTRYDLSLFHKKYNDSIIIIDEVQKEPEATSIIKHLYDNFNMKFILTGSSEVRIRKGMGDSLAGRIHEVKLYPLSLKEIAIQSKLKWEENLEFSNYDQNQENLFKTLLYGSLPNLLNIKLDKYEEYLNDYTNVVFSKDVLEVAGTRKGTQVYLLAKLLALQIGQLVNFNELAVNTEMSRESVYRYIDIFEQMGLIVKAKPISTNKRESISKATKIYFVDLGVRNSLIGNFENFSNRVDKGQLLENAVFIGIKRKLDYQGNNSLLGFFRSEYGSEIDIVLKKGKSEKLYEIKTGKQKIMKRKSGVQLITLDTAQKFLY